MNHSRTEHPDCPITARWPLLKRIAVAERQAFVDAALRGETLTVEQALRLGVPRLAGAVLAARDGAGVVDALLRNGLQFTAAREQALAVIADLITREAERELSA